MQFLIEPIAKIHNNFTEKFGIPRQSGLLENEVSTIIFEEKYRDGNSLRGLEDYSHIWLLWIFNDTKNNGSFSPTVRPPRLGGNTRMGVFATRSPYHPNRVGMSCVKIKKIVKTYDHGYVIEVYGADLMNGTPIIDIKPYLAISDRIDNAKCGFSEDTAKQNVLVEFDDCIAVGDELKKNISDILCQDPRPSYKKESDKVYGIKYADYEVKFSGNKDKIKVISIEKL